jgi:hypothetical protein
MSLYVGFTQDGIQSRLGINAPFVQDFFQNTVVHGPRGIPRFKLGNYLDLYGSHRRNNPFIW